MPLRLEDPERELVAAEASHYAARLSLPAARAAYERLASAAREGEIGDDLIAELAGLLQVGLTSGRIRAAYGPHGELAAGRLFRRTPAGRRLQAEVEEANRALAALTGQRLEGLALSPGGPGRYSLTVRTERCQVEVACDPAGVAVRRVEISLRRAH